MSNEVLMVRADNAVEAIAAYMEGRPLPEGAYLEDFEVYAARGRVPNCTCGLIECLCTQIAGHTDHCRFKVSALSPVCFPCEHDLDVCATCTPCTCGFTAEKELAAASTR